MRKRSGAYSDNDYQDSFYMNDPLYEDSYDKQDSSGFQSADSYYNSSDDYMVPDRNNRRRSSISRADWHPILVRAIPIILGICLIVAILSEIGRNGNILESLLTGVNNLLYALIGGALAALIIWALFIVISGVKLSAKTNGFIYISLYVLSFLGMLIPSFMQITSPVIILLFLAAIVIRYFKR